MSAAEVADPGDQSAVSDLLPARRLRWVLEDAMADAELPMKALTVLAPQHDPYRIDTPAGHRDGQWFAAQVAALGRIGRALHLRGFHYAILSAELIKPNGEPYANTEDDWDWLQERAADAARWLGYVPFEQIIDQRNAAPLIRLVDPAQPWPSIEVGSVELLLPDELTPTVRVDDFVGVQPYRLVMIGEKSSLEPVLGPIAEEYDADLYLPTGEPSDTMIHTLARTAAYDGRPARVFYFSDCDPSGWQMPVSVSRKLQALGDLLFPDLDIEVYRVALTPDQVRAYGLPSSPLKDTERRADKWVEAMGVEQTEIDALAELRPDLLERLARDALDPFFDHDLEDRVSEAESAWLEEAQTTLEDALGSEELDRIRTQAEEALAVLRERVAALNQILRVDTGGVALPEAVVPDAEADGENGVPLFSSEWSYIGATTRLIASKAYRIDDEDEWPE